MFAASGGTGGPGEDDDEGSIIAAMREGVLEVLVRGPSSTSSKRSVEREIEGWRYDSDESDESKTIKSIPWSELLALRDLGKRTKTTLPPIVGGGQQQSTIDSTSVQTKRQDAVSRANAEARSTDPTASLSFNLNLTDAQQVARAAVPLPYAHEGSFTHLLLFVSWPLPLMKTVF